jgi:hypothetical protein
METIEFFMWQLTYKLQETSSHPTFKDAFDTLRNLMKEDKEPLTTLVLHTIWIKPPNQVIPLFIRDISELANKEGLV